MSGWRIAVLGNSHVVSLWAASKKSGTALPEGIGSVTPFARQLPQGALDNLVVRDGRLEPAAPDEDLRQRFRRSAGVDHIDTRAYDAYLIHSFGPEPGALLRAADSLEGHRYSDAFFQAYRSELRKAWLAKFRRQDRLAELCRVLRSATDAPVFATHRPLYAEHIGGKPRRYAAGAVLYAEFESAFRDVLAEWRCSYLPPPPETIVSGCLTAERYAVDDLKHMNAEYGRLQLARLADELASFRAPG